MHEKTTIRLATTTSLRDSGLLSVLLPEFTDETDIHVDVIAVGSGAALSLAENKDVDVLIVHDPVRELEFIENGFAENRTTFAWNRFVLLGPTSVPGNLSETLTWLLENDQCFVSRGDESGTHQKEQAIWKAFSNQSNVEFTEDSLGISSCMGRLSIDWTGNGSSDYDRKRVGMLDTIRSWDGFVSTRKHQSCHS